MKAVNIHIYVVLAECDPSTAMIYLTLKNV